jgi:hypothetical protein
MHCSALQYSVHCLPVIEAAPSKGGTCKQQGLVLAPHLRLQRLLDWATLTLRAPLC